MGCYNVKDNVHVLYIYIYTSSVCCSRWGRFRGSIARVLLTPSRLASLVCSYATSEISLTADFPILYMSFASESMHVHIIQQFSERHVPNHLCIQNVFCPPTLTLFWPPLQKFTLCFKACNKEYKISTYIWCYG